jgi:hypothetical protein
VFELGVLSVEEYRLSKALRDSMIENRMTFRDRFSALHQGGYGTVFLMKNDMKFIEMTLRPWPKSSTMGNCT